MNFISEILGLNPAEYNDWGIHWATEDAGPALILWGLLVAAALWFFWTSLSRVPSPLKKWFLFGLRLGTFLLLVGLLLRPELEFRKSHSVNNAIAVLLDDSLSLSIKTFPEEKPRIDLVRQTLESHQDYWDSLKTEFDLEFYLVSDGLDPVPADDVLARYRPRGVTTDFTRVFSQLQKRYEDKSLQGVLLFSDGADLTQEPQEISSDLVKALAKIPAPIHTLQAGSNERFKDLAIENLDVADFGFVQQQVNLTVAVNATSMGNKNIPLVLKEGENVLVSKMLEVREGRTRYKVDLNFTPTSLGQKVYSLSLPLFAGESITTNNRSDFMIDVIRDRIRVLHLNGRPSWDSRFLREVLINNPKVDLLSFFILRTLGDEVAAPTAELSLIPFPSNLLFSDYLGSFDLVIFQNFRFSPYIDRRNLDNIKSYVRNGGAFLMIGGELSFQGGGYERTDIEQVLPVTLQRVSTAFLNDEYRSQIKQGFKNHPILRLEKEEAANRKIWESLPLLNGVNTGLVPVPGAQVLATYEKKGNPSTSYPLLVGAKQGKGRSLILATDSSWNWNFLRVGAGGSGRYYQRFWNNVLAWLTGDPGTRKLQLETDKQRYLAEEQVWVKLKALDDSYNPAAHEKISLTLSAGSNIKVRQTLETDADGNAALQFRPGSEGFFTAHAEWDRKDEKITEEVSFGVFNETAEFQKPLVNASLLQKIAEVSGGGHRVLDRETDLRGIRFENPEVFVKTKTKTLPLWNNWASYGLILGFLLVDWYLRRKSGLS